MSRTIGRGFNPHVWAEYLACQHALLPEIPHIEQVSPRVIRIQAGNPGEFQLQGTSTYLVGTGRSRILIDTGEGVPIWLENLVHILETENIEISHVLVTHWHGDHTGGIAQLVEVYPQLATAIYKNQPDQGQLPLHDGQVFAVEGATVSALFAPGHAEDHMCFVLEEENALFTGDNILGHGFTVVEDLSVFMGSLAKMQKRNCGRGYPAHGLVISDLPGKTGLYLGRYLRRERQVLAVLKQSQSLPRQNQAERSSRGRGKGLTVAEIVGRLYGEVSEEVARTALQPSVEEILEKLADDRRVGFELEMPVERRESWTTARLPRNCRRCKRWFVIAG